MTVSAVAEGLVALKWMGSDVHTAKTSNHHLGRWGFMYVCVCVCMYVCMGSDVHTTQTINYHLDGGFLYMYVCMYVHACVPVCTIKAMEGKSKYWLGMRVLCVYKCISA